MPISFAGGRIQHPVAGQTGPNARCDAPGIRPRTIRNARRSRPRGKPCHSTGAPADRIEASTTRGKQPVVPRHSGQADSAVKDPRVRGSHTSENHDWNDRNAPESLTNKRIDSRRRNASANARRPQMPRCLSCMCRPVDESSHVSKPTPCAQTGERRPILILSLFASNTAKTISVA